MRTSTLSTAALACFVAGIFAGSQGLPHAPSQPFLLLAAVLFLAFWRRKSAALLLVAAAFAGHAYVTAWRWAQWSVAPPSLKTTAVIVEPPDRRQDKTLLTVQQQGMRGRLLITADRFPVWQYGDQLRIEGKTEPPAVLSGFNYPRYLERFGIVSLMPRPKKLQLDRHAQANPLLAALYALAGHLESTVQATLPEPESSFLAGILLGSKRSIPGYVQDALRQTGTSHIIAISGANITILLSLVLQLVPAEGSRSRLFWTIAIAGFVTLMTGASASVVRGAIVAIGAAYLRYRSRKPWATPFILCCATAMLLQNPLLLAADPGFQLSFAAFMGLAYAGGPVRRLLERRPLARLPQALKSSLGETMSATLGTAIPSLLTFGQLSFLGLLVNPLVLWPLPLVTMLGLVLLTFGWIPGVSAMLRLPLWLALHGMLGVIQSFGRLQIGVIHLTPVNAT